MDLRKIGLLCTSFALLIFTGLLPFLKEGTPVNHGAHFFIGLLLGAGLAMMLGARVALRRRPRCSRP